MLKDLGKKIVLRPYTDIDFEVLYGLRNDFELQSLLLTYPRPNKIKNVLEWIMQKTEDRSSVFFVISDPDKLTKGFIQATQMDFVSGTCYIGIALIEEFRGKEIALNSIFLLEEYLINVFNIRKVLVNILSDNENSIKTFSRAGFKTVGSLSKHFYFQREYHDVIIMEKIHKLN